MTRGNPSEGKHACRWVVSPKVSSTHGGTWECLGFGETLYPKPV